MSFKDLQLSNEAGGQNTNDHVRFIDDDQNTHKSKQMETIGESMKQEQSLVNTDQSTKAQSGSEEGPSPDNSRRSSSAKKAFKLTLPDILKYKYGLIKAGDDKGEGASKGKPKKKIQTFAFDDEREKENKKLKEQEKYIQLLGHLERLKEQSYEDYMATLRVKVHKQHTELKHRSAKQQQHQNEKLEKARVASHTVQKRLPCHTLNHDDTFLHDVYRSRLHKAVTLQDRMVKDGTLKYTSDIDDFWTNITKQPSRAKSERIEDSPDHMEETQDEGQLEQKDVSKQGSSDSWAVTQMYSHQNKLSEQTSPGPGSVQPQYIRRSSLKVQSPRKPPNTVSLFDLPNVCLFKIDLSQKPPDPEEIRQRQVLKSREHSRKKFMRKLHKMYQLAQANEVAANRILKSTHADDLEFLFQGPMLNEVIDTSQFISVRQKAIGGPETQCDSLVLVALDEVRSLASPESLQPAIEAAEKPDMSLALVPVSVAERPGPPLPLTMTALTENGTIIEAKCLSTNWVNYMKNDKPSYIAPT